MRCSGRQSRCLSSGHIDSEEISVMVGSPKFGINELNFIRAPVRKVNNLNSVRLALSFKTTSLFFR